MNNMSKFFLIIFILFLLYHVTGEPRINQYFTNTKDVVDININTIFDPNIIIPYHYDYMRNYDIPINTLSYKIAKMAMYDKNLLNRIEQKILQISGDIRTNKDLKFYLKFKNIINDDNMLFFVDEDPMEFLKLKIKLILILLPKNNLIFQNLELKST